MSRNYFACSEKSHVTGAHMCVLDDGEHNIERRHLVKCSLSCGLLSHSAGMKDEASFPQHVVHREKMQWVTLVL